MVVEDAQMGGEEIKRMDYSFDLVSGNVNRVSYQHGRVDQFHHVYSYDADNRIRDVFTTETTPLTSDTYGRSSLKGEPVLTPYWHKDATYSYYKHGPLARRGLGSQNVQGIDYMYTIQGWLKGVNATDLSKNRSYRMDGYRTAFAKDVYSYGLHYFENDYLPINTNYHATSTMPFAAQPVGNFLKLNSSDLYNGNIARMVTTITEPSTRKALVLGNAYRYDQLNRIKNSVSNVDAYDKNNYKWQQAGTAIYDNNFVYDANGNILTQRRYNENLVPVDDLLYSYESGRNRLISVNDQSVNETKFPDDIDYSEYTYDAEGRLISDSQENISDINWRVDGKVKAILRGSSIPNQKNIIFDYDALGHRIAKHIFTDEFNLEKSTYYVLDATGNVMATYDKEIDYNTSTVSLKLKERSIYGSSRLGVRSSDMDMLSVTSHNFSMKSVKYEIGKRTYELSNHLGNVLSVISDKVIPSFEAGNLAGMLADVRVAQDYSPFGVVLSGRSFEVDGGYRYTFNGMEKDDEVKGKGNSYDFGARMYDSRLGRWLTIDPLAGKYPNFSPYSFCENNPIYFKDPDGKDAIITIDGNNITVSAKIYIMNSGKNKINVAKTQKAIMKYWGKEFSYTDGEKKYNVKFDIQVKEADGTEDPNDASKNWVRPMADSFRSEVDAAGGRYGLWAKNKADKTYAHEVGHMLGLADQYVDFELQENNMTYGPGTQQKFSENVDLIHPKDDIMGATRHHKIESGSEKVDQSAINAIAKYALDRLKNNKTVNGKVILDKERLLKDGYKNGLNPPNRNDFELEGRHKNYSVKEAHKH
jgi:RHS repeat-associated protein